MKLNFSIEVEFADKVTAEDEINEVANAILRALVSEIDHGGGLAPEDSETFTKAIKVSTSGMTAINSDYSITSNLVIESKPKFYEAVLKEIPVDKIIEHCYPIHHKEITLEERMGDCSCPDCGKKEWILLPKESCAVREGGKDYCECIECGYRTHL